MSTNNPARVAIVGGGIAGLSTAWYLEQSFSRASRQLNIELFERQPRLGGKIFSQSQDGMVLEMGAESFLSRKTAALDLCRELGIARRLRGTRPENRKTFVWYQGRMHRLPTGLSGFVPGRLSSLFSTSLLNLSGKLRVAADSLIPPSRSDEDESLANFLTRRLGRQAYQRLVQPLLCGIYAGDGDQLSLLATYPELRKLERQHGGLIRGLKRRQRAAANAAGQATWPPFVTLPGGMSDLIDALAHQLQRTQIWQSRPVESVSRDASSEQWILQRKEDPSEDADPAFSQRFDAVVVACPAFVAARLLATEGSQLTAALRAIDHVSTATVNIWYSAAELTHPLEGYGFVVPASEQRGLTAATWVSSKHYDRAPKERRLLRAYVGRAGSEVDDRMTDGDIETIVRRELQRIMGITQKPLGVKIHRWFQGSPQYTLGHPERLQFIDQALSRLPGLFLCGASYRGVGIPDCIADARRTADALLKHLETRVTHATEI